MEDQRSSWVRDTKDKAKTIRAQAAVARELEDRLAAAEKSVAEARRSTRQCELASEGGAKQAKADRQVLVECMRQMAH